MMRILFVDDEPRILEGLQRTLRPLRREWEMTFVDSGEKALAALDAAPFDVLVTDMRMPAMDGAQLLQIVCERFPAVIRIVLSGYFDRDTALRAVPVAHQYLAKPCDLVSLRETVERCSTGHELLKNADTRRVVAAIGTLPALPRTSNALSDALADPDVSLDRVATIVEQDVGITAKLLQLVNSAFFGCQQEISTVRLAISFLGFDILRQLVLSVEVFRSLTPARPIAHFSLPEFQRHSRLTADIAAHLGVPRAIEGAATMAALLHDTGELVLASRLTDKFEEALILAHKERLPVYMVEREHIGTTHEQIGAYLLALWGLPVPLVKVIAHHHHPSALESDAEGLSMLAAVHVADALAARAAAGGDNNDSLVPPGLDENYIAACGLEPRIPEWEAMAVDIARKTTIDN